MFSMKRHRVLIRLMMVLNAIGMFAPAIEAASCNVLVVMSYEEKNPWCMEIMHVLNKASGKPIIGAKLVKAGILNRGADNAF